MLNQDEKAFDYGDHGSWFYIILKGSVGIKVPMVETMEITQEKLAKFIIKNK